jgi:hypothetical protein
MDHNDPFLQRLVDQFCPDILDDIGDMGGTSDMGDLSFLATTDEVLIANLPLSGFPPPSPLPSSSPQPLPSPIYPTSVLSNTQPPASLTSAISPSIPQIVHPPPSPMLSLSSSAPPLQLRQTGPNTFEVITGGQDEDEKHSSDLDHETNPSQSSSSSDLASSISLPSSSSSTSSPTNLFQPLEASVVSKEEKRRRRNNEACAKNRKKKKILEEEETSELERLEEKNRNLKTTVQQLEESLAWQKSLMIPLLTEISRKRKGYGGDGEGKGKKKKQ